MKSRNVVQLFDQEVSTEERKFLDLVDRSIEQDDCITPLNPKMFSRIQELRERARANREADAIEL